jgi:two-component system, NarL family, nitrate/nitrite response regulator NarL
MLHVEGIRRGTTAWRMGARLERTRVYVADDHPLYREGVIRAIKEWPEFELVGSTGNGRKALEEIRELEPRVAVLDLRMPGLDAITITKAIERDGLPTHVLLISASTDTPTVYQAVRAGAYGYVSKDAGRREICEAIAAVSRGDTVLSKRMQDELVAHVRGQREEDRPVLTSREREVLTFLAEGSSAPQIAEQLYLSTTTVKTHLANLYGKLGVSDRAAAVAEAMRRGLLE